jgi:hypothetical protein
MDAVTPPFVDPSHIRGLTDAGSYERGRAYLAEGAVQQLS